jgi:hypothetical protein
MVPLAITPFIMLQSPWTAAFPSRLKNYYYINIFFLRGEGGSQTQEQVHRFDHCTEVKQVSLFYSTKSHNGYTAFTRTGIVLFVLKVMHAALVSHFFLLFPSDHPFPQGLHALRGMETNISMIINFAKII